MQTQDAIQKRRSIREFANQEIPRSDLLKIIDAGRLAPTARNVQPWEFIVITDIFRKQKIAQLASPNGAFIKDCASCVAVFCEDTKYYLEDGCAATDSIILSASDLGIGSCWVAGDKKSYCDEVRRELQVPGNYKLVSLIALGYPKNDNLKAVSKKPLEAVLHWEKF